MCHCMEDDADDDPIEPEVVVTRVPVTAFRPVKTVAPAAPSLPLLPAAAPSLPAVPSVAFLKRRVPTPPTTYSAIQDLPTMPSPLTLDAEFEEVEF